MPRLICYPGAGGRQIVVLGENTAEAARQAIRSEAGASAAAASAASAAAVAGTLAGVSGFIRACGRELLPSGGIRFRVGRRLYGRLTAAEGFRFYKAILPKGALVDDDLTTGLSARLLKFVMPEIVTGFRWRVGKRLLGTWNVRDGLYPRRMVIPAGARLDDDLTKTIVQRLASPVAQDLTKANYWGDSRTAGAGESDPNTIRQYVAALMPTLTHTNKGIGGQTSIMIAARQGGSPLRLSVTGNQIPATTTPVAVTAWSCDIFSSSGTGYAAGSHAGTLAGVPGTFASNGAAGGAGLTFTRTTAGSAVNIEPFSPFIPDAGQAARNTLNFICIGTNGAGTDGISGRVGDFTFDTVRHALAMVQAVLAGGGVPMVASVIGNNPVGAPSYTAVDQLNQQLRSVLGRYYVDFETPPTDEEIGLANAAGLGSTVTLDATNLADRAAGRWPRVLYADSVHFLRHAQYIQALRIKRHLKTWGYL